MLGLDVGVRAQFDVDDPRVPQDILDEDPVVRVRLEYPSEDGTSAMGTVWRVNR